MRPLARPLVEFFGYGLVLTLTLASRAADEVAARFPFVIPGDDASASITSRAALARPAGADGFVHVQGGHFSTDAGRIKFWGVNTCFGADFPERAEADFVAAHFAKLGINAVRLHHHDTSPAPRGIWGPVVDGRRTFDAAQVERLDYFLAALQRNGVYANLNLHVGREVGPAEGFDRAGLPYATRMDKYLLYFEPQLKARLKEFCRDYLLHVNPLRKLRRVDDPAIAMIEITNENSFSKLGPQLAAELPAPHRDEFKRQWNAWLARRYPSTAALRVAWAGANEPLGPIVADAAAWRTSLGAWRIKQDPAHGLRPSFGQGGPEVEATALRLESSGPAGELSARELQLPGLKVAPSQVYTLTFWARADASRPLYVDLSNADPGNWEAVGLRETLTLTTQWQQVRRVFRTSATIPGAVRLCFKFGDSTVPFTLAGVTLRAGGDWLVLPAGQSIEGHDVEIPLAGWSEPARRDVQQFMVDTEEAFIRELVAFLKHDLGVRVPITASQVNYHTPAIVAATCDYADIHAYWQHPRFPRKPWDPVDWMILNTPMERAPDADAVLARAPLRLLDRPYTMSEWNIPDPSDYAAGTVPFAAVIAALQDWDGIFFFQYQSGGEAGWTADRVQRFFSFNGQPVKLALFTACANLFVRGDLAPLADVARGTLDQPVPATLGFMRRIGIDPQAKVAASLAAPTPKRLATPDGAVVWDATDSARAQVTVNTPATRAVWGLIGGRRFELGDLTLAMGAIEHDYAAVVITTLDAQPLGTTRRALLTLAGSAQNVDMRWNAARTSVGNDWGRGPAHVNGITADVTLPRAGAHLYALDGRGHRTGEVPAADPARKVFRVGPEYRTLWYEASWP